MHLPPTQLFHPHSTQQARVPSEACSVALYLHSLLLRPRRYGDVDHYLWYGHNVGLLGQHEALCRILPAVLQFRSIGGLWLSSCLALIEIVEVGSFHYHMRAPTSLYKTEGPQRLLLDSEIPNNVAHLFNSCFEMQYSPTESICKCFFPVTICSLSKPNLVTLALYSLRQHGSQKTRLFAQCDCLRCGNVFKGIWFGNETFINRQSSSQTRLAMGNTYISRSAALRINTTASLFRLIDCSDVILASSYGFVDARIALVWLCFGKLCSPAHVVK